MGIVKPHDTLVVVIVKGQVVADAMRDLLGGLNLPGFYSDPVASLLLDNPPVHLE